jgi:apolipoprotein D and lipocalin family protein
LASGFGDEGGQDQSGHGTRYIRVLVFTLTVRLEGLRKELMRPIRGLLAATILVAVHGVYVETAGAQELAPPTTVEHVDLSRYTGLWYEIARIPNKFQDQCAWGVTAEYGLRDDGRIDVTNRCYESDGKVSEAKGLARIEDAETNAKLKVSFFSVLGWRPIWGDYWIIDLGENYEYAIVGSPDRKYGWVLARSHVLDDSTLDRILARLNEQGFSHHDFQLTQQRTAVGR